MVFQVSIYAGSMVKYVDTQHVHRISLSINAIPWEYIVVISVSKISTVKANFLL